MKLYDKISDIFTEEKVTLEAAYTVCMAMAECIYQYMLFGDTSEENYIILASPELNDFIFFKKAVNYDIFVL